MGKGNNSIFEDKDLLKKAYKKLKTDAYYDKTKVILKKEIVEFESRQDDEGAFDAVLCDLQNKLINFSDEEWHAYIRREILDKIDCIFFPKKFKRDEEVKRCIISNVGRDANQTVVSDIQSFIHLPIIGHILSVAWVLTIGADIDAQMTNCYGNRLKEDLYTPRCSCQKERHITFSPYLFKFYYEQYTCWQDNALKIADMNIKNDEEVLIFTLDFQRFFYSMDITSKFMNDILKPEQFSEADKACLQRLNEFVYEVIKKYSDRYRQYHFHENRNILPIGFLPSNILSNFVLKNFDETIVNKLNPLYFGRYVDDVIIVDKISRTHPLYKKLREGALPISTFFAEYFGVYHDIGIIKETDQNEDTSELKYCLTDELLQSLGKSTKIRFNMDKCKIFYFSPENYPELLTRFLKHLEDNKSEFRFLPENELVFGQDSYADLFDMEQHEFGKFRDISEILLSKYKLSKFLARRQQILSVICPEKNDSIETLINILTDRQMLENYALWERIVTIISLQKNKSLLRTVVIKIVHAIEKIYYESPEKTRCRRVTIKMKSDLYDTLFYGVCRVQSVLRLFNNDSEFRLRKACNSKRLGEYHNQYNRLLDRYEKTRMGDKYLYALWSDILIACQSAASSGVSDNIRGAYNFYDLQSVLELLTVTKTEWKDIEGKLSYKYSPYLVQNYDIFIAYQCLCMSHGYQMSQEKFTQLGEMYDRLFRLFIKVNFNPYYSLDNGSGKSGHANYAFEVEPILPEEPGNKFGIFIDNETEQKIRIAVSNIKMNHGDAEDNLDGLPTNTVDRYKKISRLVNCALQDRANLLVMPECCIPFKWLGMLIHTCKKSDLAVITGIEHVLVGRRAYNLVAVILPFKKDGFPCAIVAFHPKNHFSPMELQTLSERSLIPMDADRLLGVGNRCYELYCWHDFYFSVYCCFELSSISDRALFQSYADAIFAVEWNADVFYYRNILESLARDLHCYCIQANSSDYGDSRITQPSRHEEQDILCVKGGEEPTVLVGTIDVEKLRKFQCKGYGQQKSDGSFKPTPPLFKKEVVEKKLRKEKLFKKS